MKKLVLMICAICLLLAFACDSNVKAAGSYKENAVKVFEHKGMHVYKFDVKDNSGKTHEILICGTGWTDGGICMLELNK